MKRLVIGFLASLCGISFSSLIAADRPNVLWIYLEDVSGWFSCYGDEIIETPNIDALAASGIRYNRFYTPAGVCSATRSAIVTGMMQTSIGAQEHRSSRSEFRGKNLGEYDRNDLPEGMRTIPEIMRANGYWTFDDNAKDDYNFTFDTKKMYSYQPDKQEWGPEPFVSGRSLAGNTQDKPWFGQIQLQGGKSKGVTKVVDRAGVPVPPYYPDIPRVREEIAHHYDTLLHTDERVGKIIAKLKASGEYENTLIFLFSDHGYRLHRHKQFLYEGGIRMPFIVAGPGIEAGQVSEDLISGIDISATTLAAGGIEIPAYMEGKDFLRPDYTAREYVIAARDRCDFTIEEIRAVVTPQFKYLRNYMPEVGYMQASYKDRWPVSKEFRRLMKEGNMTEAQRVFFRDDKDPEELYDLENDPHEIHNLAEDPKFAQELQRHREILDAWIEATGDQGIGPESDLGLRCVLKRWGDRCVHPQFDRIRAQLKTQ
ncbi:MAG: sulfatase family protein [Opitutales bacterium]